MSHSKHESFPLQLLLYDFIGTVLLGLTGPYSDLNDLKNKLRTHQMCPRQNNSIVFCFRYFLNTNRIP